MNEKTIDTLSFVLGLIKCDAYLSFYFDTFIKRTKMKVTLEVALTDFTEFRKSIKDEKNASETPLTIVTRIINLEPENK